MKLISIDYYLDLPDPNKYAYDVYFYLPMPEINITDRTVPDMITINPICFVKQRLNDGSFMWVKKNI